MAGESCGLGGDDGVPPLRNNAMLFGAGLQQTRSIERVVVGSGKAEMLVDQPLCVHVRQPPEAELMECASAFDS